MAANLIAQRVLLLCLALPALAFGAEQLTDPTRPPAGIGEGEGSGGGVAQARMAPSMKGLTSVIMSAGRCAAIIDGRTVRLGEMHEGARLVEITAGAVVLEGNGGRHTLQLFQGVGVKPTRTGEAPLPPANVCKLDARTADSSRMKVRKAPVAGGQKEKK